MRCESRAGMKSRVPRRRDAMAEGANDMQDQAREDITGREEGQDDFGIFPDDGDEETEKNDGERGLATGPGDVFEAVVADGAGHERAEGGDNEQPGPGPALVVYRSF